MGTTRRAAVANTCEPIHNFLSMALIFFSAEPEDGAPVVSLRDSVVNHARHLIVSVASHLTVINTTRSGWFASETSNGHLGAPTLTHDVIASTSWANFVESTKSPTTRTYDKWLPSKSVPVMSRSPGIVVGPFVQQGNDHVTRIRNAEALSPSSVLIVDLVHQAHCSECLF